MRNFGLTLAIVLAVGLLCACSERHKPEQYEMIWIEVGLWSIKVRPDGSGHYGFGSRGFDMAEFPAGTFDFAQLVEQMSKDLRTKSSSSRKYRVILDPKGDASGTVLYSRDQSTVRAVFERAFAAATNDRVEQLRKDHPPFR